MRVALASSLRPEEAVLLLRGDERPFALVGEWAGLRAILGSEPVRVAGAGEDPFALLDEHPASDGGDAVVGGGWFGWLGYPLGARVEDLPPPPPARATVAPWTLAYHDHVVVFDGEQWWFEALVRPEREALLRRRAELWRERLAGPAPASRPFSVGPFAPVAPGGAGHRVAVEEAVRRIARGELFQANVCLRVEASWAGDATDLFARALPAARPRFGALFGQDVVSLSPERFLRRAGREVETDPIKGTSGDPDALRASAKDAAEHVMIVDLMRNDLGRVCAYGSVRAHPARVEAHANVFHLVSTVSGTLRDEAGDAELLRATFPPGSVTGAPKVQAMKTISWLEATARGVYTGAIGYASPLAGLELNVAIRTFELADGRVWLGAGGGIVADSDPAAELAEALTKAAGPIAAVEGRVDGPLRREVVPRRLRGVARALDVAPRPDPRLGVMETILSVDGVPQHLDDHLARLALSLAALYDADLPPDAAALVAQAARAIPQGRARVRVEATRAGLTAQAVAARRPPEERALRPFLLPGGLGPHKWLDRRLPEALAASCPPGTVPVLVDGDGCVLEAGAANVWIEDDDGLLVTPPADGRILAGVTRARLLAERGAREEPITLERLEAARSVLLSSAISGARVVAAAPAAPAGRA